MSEYALMFLLAEAVAFKWWDHKTTTESLGRGAYEKMPVARWLHENLGVENTIFVYLGVYIVGFLLALGVAPILGTAILVGAVIGAAMGVANNLKVLERLSEYDD